MSSGQYKKNLRALKVLEYERNKLSDIVLLNILLPKLDKESRKLFGSSLIALVDVLNEIGITPGDKIGHIVDELGCDYADGSFTAEQILLVSYGRGKAVEDSNLETEAMAALGITWSQANKCCPIDIFSSCFNTEDSETISGPKYSIKVLDDALKAENVLLCTLTAVAMPFIASTYFQLLGKLPTALEKIKDEEQQKIIVPMPVKFKALSRTTCNPEKSYVIIGGLGGFGLELCQWLVEREARHVVLKSRSGLKTGYQILCVNHWKNENINIIISNLNAINMDDAKVLLKMAAEVKTVAAIFNLQLWGAIGDAGVIQDTIGSDVVIGNTISRRISSCLSVLDKFLQKNL
ncbi:Fatty acid synthase [Araneus ventricosus]|uniref:Fatty acid synthase n=1 Tax=Araneus ventricosus TaxID=182803 RepID=A0A4Y2GMD0_ARAVE|nr:Fatty acid synthase [Araneus ventricosus]